jgi:hypothetical protein
VSGYKCFVMHHPLFPYAICSLVAVTVVTLVLLMRWGMRVAQRSRMDWERVYATEAKVNRLRGDFDALVNDMGWQDERQWTRMLEVRRRG